MFGLGISEIAVILIVALIFIGPDKLPEVAQKLGRLIWQIKHSSEELRKELTLPDYKPESIKNELKEELKELQEIKNSIIKPDAPE